MHFLTLIFYSVSSRLKGIKIAQQRNRILTKMQYSWTETYDDYIPYRGVRLRPETPLGGAREGLWGGLGGPPGGPGFGTPLTPTNGRPPFFADRNRLIVPEIPPSSGLQRLY